MTVRKSCSALGMPTDYRGVVIVSPMIPTISSIFPGSGSTAGGETRTITGVGFLFADTVEIGGVEADFDIVDNLHITVTMPPGAAGNADVSVTTVVGTGTLEDGYLYVAPSFSMASLPLTLWHKGFYVGGSAPWPGLASAGTSGDFTMTPMGTVGSGPNFDGADDFFESDAFVSDVLDTEYHIGFRFTKTAGAATAGSTNDPAIFTHAGSGGGGIMITTCDNTVICAHYDGAVWQEETVTIPDDEDHVLQFRLRAGVLQSKLDNGAWTAGVATAPLTISDGVVTLGKNTFSSAFFAGDLPEVFAAAESFDDATSDQIYTAMA